VRDTGIELVPHCYSRTRGVPPTGTTPSTSLPCMPETVSFDDLENADLTVETIYLGGTQGNAGDDPLAKRLLHVGTQGGFRYRGSPSKKSVQIAVLYTSGAVVDWRDNLDPETGVFTYYGDNRKPGRDLHGTRGNQLLRTTFEGAHGDAADRATVPPFLLFEKAAPGRAVRFRGLLAPGAETLGADDDLNAIWRSKHGLRFQNYAQNSLCSTLRGYRGPGSPR
jgi:Restriction endonuclease AspBHI N-terminal